MKFQSFAESPDEALQSVVACSAVAVSGRNRRLSPNFDRRQVNDQQPFVITAPDSGITEWHEAKNENQWLCTAISFSRSTVIVDNNISFLTGDHPAPSDGLSMDPCTSLSPACWQESRCRPWFSSFLSTPA
jgi:hypothetical protein